MWHFWSVLTPEDRTTLLLALVALVLAAYAAWRLLRLGLAVVTWPFRRKRQPRSVLDTPLMPWNEFDVLTLRDLLNGGCVIFGRPGSGKTSSSYRLLLGAAATRLFSGGLILAASASDRRMVERIFAACPHRLVVFDEEAGLTLNGIDFILKRGGSSRDVAQAIDNVFEAVSRGSGDGGGENSYFVQAAKRMLYFSIVIVKHATGGASPADLVAFINTAATAPASWHEENFKKTTHFRFVEKAHESAKSDVEQFDFDAACEYVMHELPALSDRTRAGVISLYMNYLHHFVTGWNRKLFSTSSEISPAVMDEGVWVLVDMPISRCGEDGAFALGMWRFLTEWHAMRRHPDAENTPLFIFADEFQNTINAYDSKFLGEGRKFRSCMVAASQSRASLYANMGGKAAEAKVDSLLNNFTHKIFHALGDVDTADWASSLVGRRMQFSLGGSEQPGHGMESFFGGGGWAVSLSQDLRAEMEADEFMYGLRTGGTKNGLLCDAVLVRSGECFEATGRGYLRLVLSQA